jgi:hypothetical protein
MTPVRNFEALSEEVVAGMCISEIHAQEYLNIGNMFMFACCEWKFFCHLILFEDNKIR